MQQIVEMQHVRGSGRTPLHRASKQLFSGGILPRKTLLLQLSQLLLVADGARRW